jgi:hypothetical protein
MIPVLRGLPSRMEVCAARREVVGPHHALAQTAGETLKPGKKFCAPVSVKDSIAPQNVFQKVAPITFKDSIRGQEFENFEGLTQL